eukprot:2256229-Amphidinium_carterae.2
MPQCLNALMPRSCMARCSCVFATKCISTYIALMIPFSPQPRRIYLIKALCSRKGLFQPTVLTFWLFVKSDCSHDEVSCWRRVRVGRLAHVADAL